MEEQEIFEKVKDAIVDALGVDDDEVKPESSLFDDLGAESLDLLDIVFRLEKTFGIKIPRGAVQQDSWALKASRKRTCWWTAPSPSWAPSCCASACPR